LRDRFDWDLSEHNLKTRPKDFASMLVDALDIYHDEKEAAAAKAKIESSIVEQIAKHIEKHTSRIS